MPGGSHWIGDVSAPRQPTQKKAGIRDNGDAELAAAGVGPVERHADRAAQVLTLIQLVADRVTGTSLAVAARIAVLNDEVRYYAMDAEPVEEPLAGERDEVLDRQRRVDDR